jgi:nucleotidyltransferase/DNA polymerase involved in DNA repair
MKHPVDKTLKEIRTIPGVGKKTAEDLVAIGINRISDLKDRDPEKLYEKLCRQLGFEVDRCMLYVFRCAVYFASNIKHDKELLKWWNWTDEKMKKYFP